MCNGGKIGAVGCGSQSNVLNTVAVRVCRVTVQGEAAVPRGIQDAVSPGQRRARRPLQRRGEPEQEAGHHDGGLR